MKVERGGLRGHLRGLFAVAMVAGLSAGCGSVATSVRTEASAPSSLAVAHPRLGSAVPSVVLTMAPTTFVLGVQPVAMVQVSCNSACGQVDFQIDGYEWGTVPLNAAGGFTTSGFPNVSVGSHTLQVTYQGNETYAATLSNPVSFSVVADGAAIPTVTLSMTPTSFVPSVTPTATVQVSCNSACGQVDFRIDGNEWATVALNANGSFTTSGFPGVSVGSHTLQVNYLGNATYVATPSNAVNFTVVPNGMTVPAVTLTMTSTSFVLSQLPTATVQVGCNAACGLVDFRIDGNEWATVPLNGNGTFVTAGLPNISLGSHTLQAFYQGNGGYAPAASNAVNFTAVPNGVTTPTVSLSMSPTSFVQGQIPTAVVQVSCNSACGYADFQIDGMEWATVPLNAGGSFTTSGFPNVSVGSHTLQVSYEGNTAYSAVVSNAVPFTVSSAGVPSGLTVSPGSLNFGSLTDLFTSAPQVVTVTNNTSASVVFSISSVSGTNPGDFSVPYSSVNCPAPLLAGASCTFAVQFTPQAPGPRSASLSVNSSSPVVTLPIALSGQGVAPTAGPATLSPTSLNFTQFGVAQTVTLTNFGNGPLTINSIGPGSTGAFAETNNCGTVLQAQSICTIYVTALGSTTNSSDTLTVVDDAAAGPQSVGLTFTSSGVSGPTALNFGAWSIGATATVVQQFSVPQKGDFLYETLTGPDASDFSLALNNCVYAETTPCQFQILFSPKATGLRTATLNLVLYGSSNPYPGVPVGSVTLTGTGQPAGLGFVIANPRTNSILPISSYDFGADFVGHTSTASLNVFNTGSFPITLNSPSVSGPNAAGFSATDTCGTLPVNGSCVLTVTSDPMQTGPVSATATISDSTGAVQAVVQLKDSGSAPGPTALPNPLQFGDTQINTQSAALPLTITAYHGDPVSVSVAQGSPFVLTQGSTCASTPCTLYVAYVPTALGGAGGTISLLDSVYDSSGFVNLSGTGGVPAVRLSTGSLTFAQRTVGSTSIPQGVTLTNTGNQTLNISSISLAGADPADYVLTNSCGSTVAAGGTCSFTVSFAPATAGTRAATVQIVSNAASSPDVVQLTGTAQAVPLADSPITGVVYGGTSPVAGAHVYLFAANTTGYGQGSVSLLSAVNTGMSDSVGAYVLTGADGSFSLTGDYSCSTGQQLYVYTLGGDSGYGANSYAGMLAAVGACPSAAVPVTVNEATTVATAYALAGFMTDATHVSSSGTALAQTGVANAFALVNNLVSVGTGVVPVATPAGNGTVPQAELNTLADVLAVCVESNGSGCGTLFGLVTPSGGTRPADTVGVALDIAHSPVNQVAALYGLTSASSPFQPRLTAAPQDWTVVLLYSGANSGSTEPGSLAIDGAGNAWMTTTPYQQQALVTVLSSTGAVLSGANGYTAGGTLGGGVPTFDPAGNVWLLGKSSNLVKMSSTGTVLSGANGFPTGLTQTSGLAIDGTGAAWAFNNNSTAVNLVKMDNNGNLLSGGGWSLGATYTPYNLAIDRSGNAWVAGSYYVNEFDPNGNRLTTLPGIAVPGVEPTGIQFDGLGNVWLMDSYLQFPGNTYVLGELSSAGTLLSPPAAGNQVGGYHACVSPGLSVSGGYQYITTCLGWDNNPFALDGAGNSWVAIAFEYCENGRVPNCMFGDFAVAEMSNTGTILSGPLGYNGGYGSGFMTPGTPVATNSATAMAVDGGGNLWVATALGVEEFVGVATPVVTPYSAGIANGTLGMRP